MAALHVRDVPDAVMAALRERARRHGRSVQDEVRRILARAAAEPTAAAPTQPLSLITVRTAGASHWRRDEIYDDEGR